MAELSLIFEIGIMVVAAALSLFLMRFLKQPILLGYLVAGIIIGPAGLKLLTSGGDIELLSEFGIIFLLFTIGAETDLTKFIRAGPTIIIGGIAQVLLTMMLAFFVLPTLNFDGALYVGLALALSSTMLVVKILQDKKSLQSLHGQLMLGFLLVQDLAVIIALPLLAAGASNLDLNFFQALGLKFLFLIGVVALLSHTVFPRLFKSAARSSEILYLTALATCFAFIGLSYFMGISLAIGAFLAGLAIAQLPYNLEVVSNIRGLRDFFVTIFFVALGLQLNFQIAGVPIIYVASLVVMVFVFKPLVLYAITQFAGYGSQTASRVGFGLMQMSEFSLILLLQGKMLGALSPEIYSVTVLVAALSMALTPYFMEFGPRLHDHLRSTLKVGIFSSFPVFSRKLRALQHPSEKVKLQNHIIILGGGRTGRYLARTFHKKYPVIVVDHNPQEVENYRLQKIPAIFGNAHNPEILDAIHAEKARLLICALPDMEEALFVTNFAKHHFHKLKLFVKANYYEDAVNLYKAGADYVILTEIIGGHIFAENVEYFLKSGKFLRPIDLDKLKERMQEEKFMHHGDAHPL